MYYFFRTDTQTFLPYFSGVTMMKRLVMFVVPVLLLTACENTRNMQITVNNRVTNSIEVFFDGKSYGQQGAGPKAYTVPVLLENYGATSATSPDYGSVVVSARDNKTGKSTRSVYLYMQSNRRVSVDFNPSDFTSY